MKMINLTRKCRDAYGQLIKPGLYFHPRMGYVRYVKENEPTSLFEWRSWTVEKNYSGKTSQFRFNKFLTSDCVRVSRVLLAEGNLVENAQWAKKRLEELAEKED